MNLLCRTRFDYFKAYLEASGQPATEPAVRELMLDAEVGTLANPFGLFTNIYDSQVPLLRGAPHPTAATKTLPYTGGDGGCETSDTPTAAEAIDLVAAAVDQVRGSPVLLDAVLKNGMVQTLHARKAGSPPLWAFLEDLQARNMLRLFGIAPKPTASV